MLKLIRVACIILTLLICVTVILSGAEKKKVEKFILPEYEKFLLDETDVPVYKLDYQGKSIWPETKEGEEPKRGIVQRWLDSTGKKFYYDLWIFNSVQEAMDGANFYSGHMSAIFHEGSFEDTFVGNKSWVSVGETGAAILFVYEKQAVLISDILCKKEERKKLQEIAEKIIKKHKEAVKE
ncbi:hypothetical protein COY52_08010 [Candidatus Desantisbacteria bacterium CG_4_10_14_0_8_um_filter_48_22]|uniref:DUF4367 domain-containing protein n=1 Tax=Candidatus Desantisbacteria bacterium CG_4_10_14_0_8_um_filter_48_22 TaxID=1974543 RepID=A0A2M7S9D1_9BACT|nr:MAG: hypothetical protein COY52_08010 [Candidatus Desantisbacteria bacterium CG_4_10_14_0_8_um_filter_48_22]